MHRAYARGRALAPDQLALWIEAFAEHLPAARPLDGLDLGSGTGRFSGALAEAFGPVLGVEPSVQMREVAEHGAEKDGPHPPVRYLPGAAEAIPAADASLDYCLMFLVWHHVVDPPRAAHEIARVLRPGGVVLCRTPLADRMPDLWWLRHFPGGPEADAAMYRPLEEDLGIFAVAGLEASPGLVWVAEPSLGTKGERLERLRTRTLSVPHRMSDDDFAAGLASLEREVAGTPDEVVPGDAASVLVLRKPS